MVPILAGDTEDKYRSTTATTVYNRVVTLRLIYLLFSRHVQKGLSYLPKCLYIAKDAVSHAAVATPPGGSTYTGIGDD